MIPFNLLELQGKQLSHDLDCHSDILNLCTKDKMTHMTLHFAKYVGRLSNALVADDSNEEMKTLMDAFIIVLSSANALNINLETDVKFPEAPRPFDVDDTRIRMSLHTGSMAKACESLDHLEGFEARKILETSVFCMASTIVHALAGKGLSGNDIQEKVQHRWDEIKAKRVL